MSNGTRPSWLPSHPEQREAWDSLSVKEATWGKAWDALCLLGARKFAEHLETLMEAAKPGRIDPSGERLAVVERALGEVKQ